MKIKTLVGALAVSALVGAQISTPAQATTFNYRDGEGTLKLYLSIETGLPVVVINTMNPQTFNTCDFESECVFTDDDEITCDAGEGLDPVIVKLRSNQRLKVKSFPSELCGAGVSAQGTYKKAQ